MTSQIRRSTGWLMASLVITVSLVGVAASRRPVAAAAQPGQLPQVMRLKLDYAQAVLSALVTEDYPALERSATELGALTKSASWGVLKTPEYMRHSADFLRETANLSASARAGRPGRGHLRLRVHDLAVRPVPPARQGHAGGGLTDLEICQITRS